uniref:Transmembrane protein n=1 Tax=Noccaea caerulescens TaxID=107243 RepID=A0A1J3ITJ1_NOCCA
MAGKLKPGQVFHLICIFSVVFFLFVFSVNVSSEADSQGAVPPEDKTTTVWLSKIKQSGNNYWGKLRETLGRGHARFFPPNVDFRGKGDPSMGAGGKMKEAVTRSFEHSKNTVEEAARSAAEVACDSAEAVKEKVKRSVSGSETTEKQSEGTEEL